MSWSPARLSTRCPLLAFYVGRLEAVEQDIVLEPEWVRQEIVVTADRQSAATGAGEFLRHTFSARRI